MISSVFWRALMLTALAVGPFLAPTSPFTDFGGGPIPLPQDQTTDTERAQIQAEVNAAIAKLTAAGDLAPASADAVSFDWPLRPAAHLTDYGYHGVSGFVDHDPVTGSLLDYTCGDRTYDLSSGYNHQGTDFFTYPYPWLKMDRMEVEIVAAAPGTLVFKRDGEYDRQCAMTGAYSNAVVIRHADGSLAHYLHMKRDSVTLKPVGAWIAAGEYLGVVGSSGSSTGPHLHFEVRSASNAVLDPFQGSCNASPSLWNEQPPYYDSAVIAVHTGDARPEFYPCPQPANPNIEDTFDPSDTIYFVTTYRDQRADQPSTYRILKPDSTVYKTWTHSSSAEHYTASYWYWAKTMDDDGPPPLGRWRFEVDFEGQTYETHFNVGVSPHITVTNPNGGEIWPPDALPAIRWEDTLNDGAEVRIDLDAGGNFHTAMITQTLSDGTQFWRIPADIEQRTDYTVRITDLADPTVYDVSDAPFTIASPPTASFTLSPTTGVVPLTVSFTDTSTSLVDERLWHFGDGLTSTASQPAHLYSDTGAYTVTLEVSGPAGSDVVTRTHAVTVTAPPPVAHFNAWPILGTPPLTVTFTDHSTGTPIESWLWSFGDGITATTRHPTHTYHQTGTYTAALTVRTAEAQDVASQVIRVVDRLWHAYLPVLLR